jgi:hypothetical protein
MPIIKQVIKGRTVGYMNLDASDADLVDLEAILEGEVSKWDQKSTGGASAPYPAELNTKKFSCGNKDNNISTSFTIRHVKPTAYKPDFKAVVVGAFDAHPDSAIKADYMNLLYDRS